MDYNSVAKEILKNVGGNANIVSTLSCFTRLRIEVRDKEIVNQEEIKKLEGVKGINFFQNTCQIVFGDKVTDVYNAFEAIRNGDTTVSTQEIKEDKKSIGGIILDYIQGTIQPVIPVFIGCGLIQGIIALLNYFNVDVKTFGYQVLTAGGSAGYFFLPIMLGFSSAKKLKINPYIGAVIGAILVYPNLITLAAKGGYASFYGLPVKLVDYSSSITPIILTMPVVYWIHKFAQKISPNILKPVLVPALCVLLTMPIMFTVTAPVAQLISEYLGKGVRWLYTSQPVLGGLIVGALCPWFVLTGVHNAAAFPIALNEFITSGYTVLFPVLGYANCAVAGASFGVSLKTKNKEFKGEALSSALIGAVGITEPALFGVMLPTKRPLIAVSIMSGICGMCSMLFKVKAFGLGLCGLGGIPIFLGETFMIWCILMLIDFFGSALITYLIGFEDIK